MFIVMPHVVLVLNGFGLQPIPAPTIGEEK
jgi:hypothetical protein